MFKVGDIVIRTTKPIQYGIVYRIEDDSLYSIGVDFRDYIDYFKSNGRYNWSSSVDKIIKCNSNLIKVLFF